MCLALNQYIRFAKSERILLSNERMKTLPLEIFLCFFFLFYNYVFFFFTTSLSKPPISTFKNCITVISSSIRWCIRFSWGFTFNDFNSLPLFFKKKIPFCLRNALSSFLSRAQLSDLRDILKSN